VCSRIKATTHAGVLREMIAVTSSERTGRLIDKDEEASMETKKREGYF
jgi:sulfate adenylyltransferase subunit 2